MERLTEKDQYSQGYKIQAKNLNSHCVAKDAKGYITYYGQHIDKLAEYENLEEQDRLIKLPCKVGDTVYLIDRDENNKFKVYEGKWKRVSLVQTSKDGSFNLRGEISYDIYDCFYNDGRMMKHGMYVGQERTKIGEVVFLTKSEAEQKLKEMENK